MYHVAIVGLAKEWDLPKRVSQFNTNFVYGIKCYFSIQQVFQHVAVYAFICILKTF